MANIYNSKNYFAHGGEELVIGGRLTFLDGAEVENFPGSASEKAPSGTAPYMADSEATTVAALKADFNILLAALRTEGVLAAAIPAAAEPDTTDLQTPVEGTEGGGT